MQSSYLLYIAGIAILAFPTGLWTRKHLSIATIEELADRPRHRFGWLHPHNAIDLVRAFGGMTLLLAAFTAVDPSAPSQLIAHAVLAIAALMGLMMQHAFYRNDEQLPAPVAYAIGLTLAILPPQIALLALPLGIASALALRNLTAGLLLAAFATAALGKLFGQSLLAVGTASLLLFLPVLLSFFSHRSLGLTVRRREPVRYGEVRDVALPTRR